MLQFRSPTNNDKMTHLEDKGFRATFDLITAESCEQGDHAACGYLDWLGDAVDNSWDSHWDLQDVLRLKGYRLEGDGSTVPRWLSADADMSDLIHCARPWGFLADGPDGEDVIGGTISIHRPDWITDSSWLRVCKMLGWSARY